MFYQCLYNPRRIHGVIRDDIDHAFANSRLAHDIPNKKMRSRTQLRRFQYHRVPARQRHGNRAHTENDRRVPRRYSQHDPYGLAYRHRETSGLVGRNHLARNLRRH